MNKSLDTSIQYLKGIGPKKALSFNSLGIYSIEDLLYYFPRRYQDRRNLVPIANLSEGSFQGIQGKVLVSAQRRSFHNRGFTILEVVVGDETGKISCVWFNQPFLKHYFKVGESVILFGRLEHFGAKLQMNSPEFEIIPKDEHLSDLNRLVPIYSLAQGITQRYFRRLIRRALDEYIPLIKEYLAFDIRKRNDLLNLAQALVNIHFPNETNDQRESYERLSFDEFLLFQLPLALRKLRKKDLIGISHQVEGNIVQTFIKTLPFVLTRAQEDVIREINSDMSGRAPMQRLLQGDVGSGKTVVAVIACLSAIQGGYQAAFMAPTEILSKQHYDKINTQIQSCILALSANGYKQKINLGFLSGRMPSGERSRILAAVKSGEINLLLGTHALLSADVEFNSLGLVVIDEQHKFGVGQRALLPQKGRTPDVLIMTATPIPRTLAITLYGDLDISVIDEMPAGRLPVKTSVFTAKKEEWQAYSIAKEHLKAGRQVFIIYPVIEESYALDIVGAKRMYQRLQENEFKEFRLGLVHGRLKQKEQDEVMLKFKNRQLDVLISTTVLEVGIDIPNASCMVIEHAERFGLAQLHQLRGRVGRGKDESVCLLVADIESEDVRLRLEAMVKYPDGFRIAEEDLRIRGPGEFFGRRQHGLTELKIADPLGQIQLLRKARREAIRIVGEDPHLTASGNMLLRQKLLRSFPEYESLMVVG